MMLDKINLLLRNSGQEISHVFMGQKNINLFLLFLKGFWNVPLVTLFCKIVFLVHLMSSFEVNDRVSSPVLISVSVFSSTASVIPLSMFFLGYLYSQGRY